MSEGGAGIAKKTDDKSSPLMTEVYVCGKRGKNGGWVGGREGDRDTHILRRG